MSSVTANAIQTLFGLLITIVGTLAMLIFKGLAEDIKAMRASMADLNVRLAVIVREVEQHSKRIDRLEDRQ